MGERSDDDSDGDLSEKIKSLEREKERLERINQKKKYKELSRSVSSLRKSNEPEPHSSGIDSYISPSRGDKNHRSQGQRDSLDSGIGGMLSQQQDRLRALQRRSGETSSSQRGRLEYDEEDDSDDDKRNTEPLMTKEHKQRLQNNRDSLVENMTPEDIFNDLISTQVVTTTEVSRIKERMTRDSMNEELLNTLVRKSDRAFYEFVRSLRKTLQGHLADLIDDPSSKSRRTQKRKRNIGELNISVDCEEVYPAQGRKKPMCSCGEVEEQILIMAKTAYKAIRRRDHTPAAFEQFKKELSQTNEIIKESMEIMHTLKILCKHGDLDISYGSVIFTLRCSSIKCAKQIWRMYKSGSLQRLFQRTLVTRSLLRYCHAQAVSLRVKIAEKEYSHCLSELENKSLVKNKKVKKCARILRSYSSHCDDYQENIIPAKQIQQPSTTPRKAFAEIQRNTNSACRRSPPGPKKPLNTGYIRSPPRQKEPVHSDYRRSSPGCKVPANLMYLARLRSHSIITSNRS